MGKKIKYKATLVKKEYFFEVDEDDIECEEDIQYAFNDWVDDQNMTGENEFFENIVFSKVSKSKANR